MCVCIPRNSSTPQTRHITFPPDIPPDYRSWHSSQVELLRWRSSAGSTASHSSFPPTASLSVSQRCIYANFTLFMKNRIRSHLASKPLSALLSHSLFCSHISAQSSRNLPWNKRIYCRNVITDNFLKLQPNLRLSKFKNNPTHLMVYMMP